jgi:Xaa-Pro aminopeptidase
MRRRPPAIPLAEFQQRWRTVQRKMAARNLDVLIAHGDEADMANVRYLSDYWPCFESGGVAFGRAGAPVLLLGPESLTFAEARSKVAKKAQILWYRESAEPNYPGMPLATFKDVFRQVSPNRQVRRIGIAGLSIMPATIFLAIKEAAGKAEVVRADDVLVEMRSVKSPNEIACMREAYRVSEHATAEVLKRMKPGMTEQQVVGIAQGAMYANGAEYEGHPTYVLSGRNSNHAIGRPSRKVLRKGEMIQLNIGALVGGYSSSVGRPVCFGKMPRLMRYLVETGRDAHYKTMDFMRAGVPAKEVVLKFEAFVRSRKCEKYLLYGPCHAIGLMEVEAPWTERTSEFRLEENMTFQVDTFLYTPTFGLRWENGVRVTSTGVEMLSKRFMDVLEL